MSRLTYLENRVSALHKKEQKYFTGRDRLPFSKQRAVMRRAQLDALEKSVDVGVAKKIHQLDDPNQIVQFATEHLNRKPEGIQSYFYFSRDRVEQNRQAYQLYHDIYRTLIFPFAALWIAGFCGQNGLVWVLANLGVLGIQGLQKFDQLQQNRLTMVETAKTKVNRSLAQIQNRN
jgi:hypothetical protein